MNHIVEIAEDAHPLNRFTSTFGIDMAMILWIGLIVTIVAGRLRIIATIHLQSGFPLLNALLQVQY